MKRVTRTFFRGFLAFLPIFLTVYAVVVLVTWLNRISNDALAWAWPSAPELPGLGIAVGFFAVVVLGMLVTSRMTRWIYHALETPLNHIPVVQDLYSAFKQLVALLAPDDRSQDGTVVSVKHPDQPFTLVGIMMRSDTSEVADGVALPDSVAVYLPMSYQIGGYTTFVPREWVTPIDLPVETAMRKMLTGWLPD